MKNKQILALSLAALMGFSALGGSVSTVHAAENISNSVVASTLANDFSSLESFLKAEGISQKEWNDFISYVKTESAKAPSEKGGIVSKVKNALKFILKHIDVIPSKALREAFQKYFGKIISAVDKISDWSKNGITNALVAVGIPKSWASLIADIIVGIII